MSAADAVSWLTDGTSKCVRAVFELPTSANPHFLAVRLCCPAPPPDSEESALAS
ncbi:hypothetical protein [Embleya sp. NPDC059259]|uniref:hypothetical protein n=1 Tax=unclassified Embleya TaxID=2699296 RepID=UPI0036A51F76